MKEIRCCPVCGSEQLQKDIACKDFLVTGENFQLCVCMTCQFKFTNPRPEDSELPKYYLSEDYVSHTNSKKGLLFRMYHLVRSFTLKRKVALVRQHVSRGTLLDYGCGTGMFLREASRSGFEAVGLEPDAGARNIAAESGLQIFGQKSDLAPDNLFDAITAWHVLEHVSDLNETVAWFKQHLNKGGIMIIAVPNHRSFDAAHYGPFWAAYDVPRHLYHFDKTSIRNLMAKSGMQLLSTHPMVFDSFYVSMLSEKYKRGEIAYLSAFWWGLVSNFRAGSASGYSSVIYVFKST